MRRTQRHPDAAALVRAMLEAGATFFFTEAGTLLVRGLDSLPAWLADEFFQADAPELARYVRELQKRDDQAA